MPDLPDGLQGALDSSRQRIAELEQRCRDLEGARAADEQQRKQVESRLCDLHDFQKQLIDSVQGLVAYDTDLRYTVWNRFMQDLSGLTPTEVVGRRPSELFPWAVLADVEQAIATALRGSVGTLDNIRFHFPKTGRSGWSSVRYYPFRNASGQILGAIGSVTETTEMRRTEQALRGSEERLRLAFAAGRMFPWDYDIATGRTVTTRDAAVVLGLPPETSIPDGEEFLEFVHPDDRERMSEAGHRSLRENVDFNVEYRMLLPQGGIRWLAVQARPHCDESGRPVRLVGVTLDIHDRKQAEIALRESEERARIAFSAARMGAFDWTVGEQKSAFFGNMMALFGRAADDEHAGYADFLQSIHPDDRPGVDAAIQDAFREGQSYNVEFRAIWPDGTSHWITEIGTVQRDSAGKPCRMIGIALDIDDRKRLEDARAQLDARVQQSQKLEMLGTLAGGVAHDFNNLLQAIVSHAGLIREYPHSLPDVQKCVAQIETAAQRARELTQQLLAYAGKGRFDVEAVDLSQLALEMMNLLEASLPPRARVLGQFPPGLPAIMGDPTQVRQVVMNLVLNAAEALPEGNGVIRLATGIVHLAVEELNGLILGAGLPPGKYVYFEACDTGCGMTEAERARIFDPFYTTKKKGRGLGLAAVLGIVRGHRGAMQVHSELGAGTVFRVLVPAAEISTKGPADAIFEPPREKSLPKTILVVDDEEAIRNSAKLLLEANGFNVVTATDGREALLVFRARQADFSAVLLDLTMPHVTGTEAFREMRAVRPDIPILVTSGYSEEEVVSQFQQGGPSGFIQKPYRNHQLRARLEEVLRTAWTVDTSVRYSTGASPTAD